jgi:hypothetical protein
MVAKKSKKTEDGLTLRIRDLRKEIRERIENELLEQCNEARSEGKYPWEGMWLRPQDIRKIQGIMKKRDRIVFAEIIAFFLLMALFTDGFYLFLTILLPR